MKKFLKMLLISVIGVGLTASITSCQKYPQADVDKAISLVDSAKTIKADLYVPQEFTALSDSLTVAIKQTEEANSKFFKNFKSEVVKLNDVSEQAEQVIEKTYFKIEIIKKTVTEGLVTLKASNDENKDLLKKAPKGKDGKAALDAITIEIANIDAAILEIQAKLDSADYLGAESSYNASATSASAIKAELTAAIEKSKK